MILHTNLGRALLSQAAVENVALLASHYSNLEYDLEHGQRGDRYVAVVGLLQRLTGAEEALVVNNNAAAAACPAGSGRRTKWLFLAAS